MKGTGEMNHKIILQVRDVATTGGKSQNTWRNLFASPEDGSCWAARRDMSTKDFYQAAANMAEETAAFTIRTPTAAALTSGLRILEKGQVYEVTGVPIADKPRRGFTELRAVYRGMEEKGHAT